MACKFRVTPTLVGELWEIYQEALGQLEKVTISGDCKGACPESQSHMEASGERGQQELCQFYLLG